MMELVLSLWPLLMIKLLGNAPTERHIKDRGWGVFLEGAEDVITSVVSYGLRG